MSAVLQRAVMFADLVGSTSLYESLGDAAAKALVDQCLRGFKQIVARYGGDVIKTLGDEVMASFGDAQGAAEAAVAMQNEAREGGRLGVRIGFHWGEVIAEDNDVFGDAVNVAARLTGAARGGQILTSEFAAAQLSPAQREQLRSIGEEHFKGKSRAVTVYQLMWEPEEGVTRIISSGAATAAMRAMLEQDSVVITLGERRYSFRASELPISLGRDPGCQIPVISDCASRVHARCEYVRGKFVISDHSTNGTYVASGDDEEVFLRRESMPLVGRGRISLGCPLHERPQLVLHYDCKAGRGGVPTPGG